MRPSLLPPLLALALLLPAVQALPPTPGALAVVETDEGTLVAWSPLAQPDADRYDVYGVAGGQASFLGFVDAPGAALLAPGGYDAYRVVALVDGEERALDLPCIAIDTDPPGVLINWYCGSRARNAVQLAPLP